MNPLSRLACSLAWTLALCAGAQAADWPARPITMIVPFAVGGSTDATARLLADRLGKELGQSVVVDNRPGAGGNIGGSLVAKAKPDGYTLLLHTSTMTTNVTLYKDMGFDVRKDLMPVSQVALIPNVLVVNKDLPAHTLDEFVAYVREDKGPVNYGSAGHGSSQHLSGALFNNMVEGRMIHVPYKGGSLANTDLLSGQIQAVFSPLVEVLPFIDSGKLRALAVTTGERSSRLPDVPAMREVLPGYEVVLWNGVFAPAGTPSEVIEKLANAIHAATQDPSVRKILADQGSIPVGSQPAQFGKVMDSEIQKWGELVKVSGARID
ncbi:tripartite tricarboxylate transporter substrate binding protein [Verticiella sediminum]|uniref:Tripartite tricarboxylate transporter substrate binding protein n=1 Tax=Verticiella sediminum TaxID=1247510 RepID=A0A556AYF5_9BURK|nr:tripartite tricarboxylate transporter substrate binding protein [Verticiella sediminum]TSH97948.1 tripartite tricarboxylate transporter substrate binding protein [Verticiella sediminum]